jgi:hypothetical protein
MVKIFIAVIFAYPHLIRPAETRFISTTKETLPNDTIYLMPASLGAH